jgi:hypothetical protein
MLELFHFQINTTMLLHRLAVLQHYPVLHHPISVLAL